MNDLINKIKENLAHYFVLGAILAIGFGTFWYYRYVSTIQLLVIFLTASVYFIWGVIHHRLVGDLNRKVVLEYLSTAVLGFIMIWFLLLRA